MHNRYCFWKPFGSECVNESQKLRKSTGKYFDSTFPSSWAKLSLEKLFLIRSEILGQLVNKLTANYEYFRNNGEKSTITNSNQMILKITNFLPYFLSIFGIFIKYPMLSKKHEWYRSNSSEVIHSEICAYSNASQGLSLKTLWQLTY